MLVTCLDELLDQPITIVPRGIIWASCLINREKKNNFLGVIFQCLFIEGFTFWVLHLGWKGP